MSTKHLNPCFLCRLQVPTGMKALTGLALVLRILILTTSITLFFVCKLDQLTKASLNNSSILRGYQPEWSVHLMELEENCILKRDYSFGLIASIIFDLLLWFGAVQNRPHFVGVVFYLELISVLGLLLSLVINSFPHPVLTVPLLFFYIYQTWMTYAYLNFIFEQQRQGRHEPVVDSSQVEQNSKVAVHTDLEHQERNEDQDSFSVPQVVVHSNK